MSPTDPKYKVILYYDTLNRYGDPTPQPMVFMTKSLTKPFDETLLRWAHVQVINKYPPDQLKVMGTRVIKALIWETYHARNDGAIKQLKIDVQAEAKKEVPPPIMHRDPDDDVDGQWNKKNITLIDPSHEGGSTCFLVGGSSSGKTSLIVQSLNNILSSPVYRNRYDLIIIFSESMNAIPMQGIKHRKDMRIQIYPFYIPELVKLAQKINAKTNNRYGIYFILDDCNELRGNMIKKQIMTLRNLGISTLVSTQYCRNTPPGVRASFHNIYVTGARNTEDQELLLKLFVNTYLRERGLTRPEEKIDFLRANTHRGENERRLLHINTTKDTMTVHTIKK